MKKTLLLVATIAAMSLSANAQWLDFNNNSHRFSIGFQIGQSAVETDYSKLGLGMSIQALGIHVDFIRVVPEHKYDNHVDPSLQYNDSSSYNINLGYQIPVLPWLRVMPLVGYCQTNYGVTDMGTLNAETSENSTTLYHDYTVTPGSRKHYFNFGVGLSIRPVKYIDIYGVYSRRAIYGGISINLDAFVDDEDFYEE